MDQKEQLPFVSELVQSLIKRVLGKECEVSVKVWTVEQRRMARNSTEVLIPGTDST